jgi:hypothetical protein
MTHEYPPGLRGVTAQDTVLVVLWFAFVAIPDVPPTVRALVLAAIPIVLGWGFFTLHFPSRIETGEKEIVFARFGREHRFAWKDVTRVRVRRFLVKDRVLVRIEPSGGAWRGRYWLFDSLAAFEPLLAELEARARR